MFDSRYGHSIAKARDDLATAVAPAADRIVGLLRDTTVIRSRESDQLTPVMSELTQCQGEIRAAVDRYPLSLAIDTDDRVDPLGAELARLLATLEYVRVFYHHLTGIPERLRSQAHRDLEGLARDANSVLAVLGQ